MTPLTWALLAWGPGAGWCPATVKSCTGYITSCVAFPSRFALGKEMLVALKSTSGSSPRAGCGAGALPNPWPQPFPRGLASQLQHRDRQTVRVFAGGCIAVS